MASTVDTVFVVAAGFVAAMASLLILGLSPPQSPLPSPSLPPLLPPSPPSPPLLWPPPPLLSAYVQRKPTYPALLMALTQPQRLTRWPAPPHSSLPLVLALLPLALKPLMPPLVRHPLPQPLPPLPRVLLP